MTFTDEELLSRYFAALEREDAYRLEEVLKESPAETTQLVSCSRTGESARELFVRKLIKRESGLGSAYGRLFDAQQKGQSFEHLPSIKECYANDDCLVVVMEFIQGESLQDYVERNRGSVYVARDVFPGICDAASELHEGLNPPLIHRDIKPTNIIMSRSGPVIIDFGIARGYRDGARADTTHFGTCSFAPPEQYGFGQTTVRSDVFALGMILFYCLTGAVPDTYIAEGDYADCNVPEALRGVIQRATAIDASDRFASTRDLKHAFFDAVEKMGLARAGASACPEEVHVERRHAERRPERSEGLLLNGLPGASSCNDSSHLPPDDRLPGESSHFNPASHERFKLLGRVWNVFLLAVLAMLLVACVGAFKNPTTTAEYPAWLNAVGYLCLMPLFFVTAAWVLFDKRRLAKRFPRLRKYKFRHWLALLLISSIVLFLALAVLVALSR